MQLKNLILCNLAILVFGNLNSKAIANPDPSEIKLQRHTVSNALKPRPKREVNIAQTNSDIEFEIDPTDTPLRSQLFQQPTAQHLRQGDVVINAYTRLYFLSDSVEDVGTSAFFGGGFTWGITDSSELTLQYQHVDSNFPDRQGDFDVQLTEDNEATLEFKQRLWQNSSQSQALSGVISFSIGTRGFRFRRDRRNSVETNRNLEVALQLPYTTGIGDRFTFTISPTIAFFRDDTALFLTTLPVDDSGSFGTTFGFAAAVSYELSPRFTLWADAFLPLTGNNSISRESGKPEDAIAYNAGIRYLVNPRLAVDVFASNTLGSVGSLALTADRDLTALGANIVFMPDFIGSSRRYPDSFDSQSEEETTARIDGLGFFDGDTVPSGKFQFDIQGGAQGVLTSFRYGLVKDLEAGIYLDAISSDVDESEQGISGKIRFLNQAEGAPFTLSLAATAGLTNETLINFTENNREEFDRLDLSRSVPFLLQGDDEDEGKLYIATLSLPFNYQFDSGAAVWFTPIVGFVQRNGTEIAGFNVGVSLPLARDFSFVGEVGANFVENGNAFIGDERENAIPWNIALRWDPSALFGIDSGENNNSSSPKLELYLTNRVGSSTWHQLRVRDQDRTVVGVGLSIPF